VTPTSSNKLSTSPTNNVEDHNFNTSFAQASSSIITPIDQNSEFSNSNAMKIPNAPPSNSFEPSPKKSKTIRVLVPLKGNYCLSK